MTNEYLLKHLNEIDKMAKVLSRRTDNYQDVRQEMCVACLELGSAPNFKYAMGAMRNKAIDYLRGRKHNYSYGNVKSHISLEFWLDCAALDEGWQGQRARKFREKYLSQYITDYTWDDIDNDITVDTILSSLNDADRRLLYNYFARGETQGEIAEHSGVSRSMVSVRLSKVLNELRKRYNGHSSIGTMGYNHELTQRTDNEQTSHS